MNSKNNYKVVYITGAPATGKSTITTELKAHVPNIKTFIYGEELTKYLKVKHASGISREKVRRNFGKIVTNEDVKCIDNQLVKFVNENRHHYHIIIDSHSVVKEPYGFRVIPLSLEKFKLINPDIICMLYTEPSVNVNRIIKSKSRLVVSEFESEFHSNLQASVCVFYAMYIDVPIFYIDTNKVLIDSVELVTKMFF